MANDRRLIGGIEVFSLSDRSREREAPPVFPDVPESAWQSFRGAGASGPNMITMNYGCYLLRSSDITVLVDTGVGGDLISVLQATGTQPEDVQAVAYTHLHGDHIAWNLSGPDDKPRLTFPNARYYVPRGDWSYYVEQGSPGYSPAVHGKFRPLEERGLVQLVDDGASIGPGLTVWATPGHTPGHCSIVVQSGDDRAIVVGDALIHPIQVGHPEWNTTWDHDPDTATRTRRLLIERMEREQSLGGVSHFAPPGFGRIVKTEDQYVWQLA